MSRYLEFNSKHMGGTFTVRVFPSSFFDKDKISKIIKDSFKVVSDIEEKLTDFKDSPFNEINRKAGVSPVVVDREIMDLILKSQDYSIKSSGLFDISYASVGHIWRKYLKDNIKPDEAEIQELKSLIDFKNILVSKSDMTVFLPHKGMKISLGGIGKGYAVDKLFEKLRSQQIENFQINGSGDIRVH